MGRLILGLVLGLFIALPGAVMTLRLGLEATRHAIELRALAELKDRALPEKTFVRVTLHRDQVEVAGWYPGQSAAVLKTRDANVYAQLRPAEWERLDKTGTFDLLGYVTQATVGMPGVAVTGPELVHWPSGVTTWTEVALLGTFTLAVAIGAWVLVNGWRLRRKGTAAA
jgi:hypothetical protein